jgi:DNA-binding SARP family transcriptional activator/basic membrane lipoprotein Med (substrate-binding protein (PBP1-ABC) superfamily)
VGERRLPLGGSKQRAVLALLLLHANEVVTVERLIDGLWGEEPPPSARHSLEGYVSRLRGAIGDCGATIVRRGPGYALLLGGARLDADSFRQLADAGNEAAAGGDHERAAEARRRALALWRGQALVDVSLGGSPAAAVEHLEELRLGVLERRIDSDLELGRHEDLVAELQALVEEHPFRQRFVAQLMLALHRCERSVEALELYDQTRRRLDEELGLRPSEALRRLSGDIVRQEPELAPAAVVAVPPARPPLRSRRRALAAATLAAAGVVAALLLGLLGVSSEPAAAGVGRVALLLPRLPEAGREDTFVNPFVDGLTRAAREWDLDVELLAADENDASSPSRQEAVERLRSGGFGLILVATFPLGETVAPLVSELPASRFVFFEAALEPLGISGAGNATAIAFAGEEASYLAGYLAGLVKASREPRLATGPTISVIGAVPDFPFTEAMIEAFIRGARKTFPEVKVLRDYSGDFVDRTRCEAIANRQIDAGSDVVFAVAGTCSLGALAAAGLRGVWAVGVDADRSELGDHVLASAVKRFDRAVVLTVRWAAHGTLRGGRDLTLGLEQDAVGLTGISPRIPASIRQAVALEAASLARGG